MAGSTGEDRRKACLSCVKAKQTGPRPGDCQARFVLPGRYVSAHNRIIASTPPGYAVSQIENPSETVINKYLRGDRTAIARCTINQDIAVLVRRQFLNIMATVRKIIFFMMHLYINR